jgi:hypothetical protein
MKIQIYSFDLRKKVVFENNKNLFVRSNGLHTRKFQSSLQSWQTGPCFSWTTAPSSCLLSEAFCRFFILYFQSNNLKILQLFTYFFLNWSIITTNLAVYKNETEYNCHDLKGVVIYIFFCLSFYFPTERFSYSKGYVQPFCRKINTFLN